MTAGVAPITPGSGIGVAVDIVAENLTGTVAKNGTAVTGVGSLFTAELVVGGVIRIPGTTTEDRVISAIASNTALTVSVAFTDAATGQVGQRVSEVQKVKDVSEASLFVPRTVRSRPPVAYDTLFVENFRSPVPGRWNDGRGSSSRDTDIWFMEQPTLRLDPQGQTNAAATNPGRTAITSGVVAKMRMHDGFTGVFGMEFYFRYTSPNLTSNTLFSVSVYNRTGTDAYHGRLWLDPNGNNQPLVGRILDGTATAIANGGSPLTGTIATYVPVVTSVLQNGAGSHLYDPSSGRMDKAGGWHFARLVVDFANLRYVSVDIDGQPTVDLSSYTLDHTTSTGFAGMHFSLEMSASTATRPRYINVAAVKGLCA